MYTDFEYFGKRLSDFGCILCRINTESGLREVNIGCDITFTKIKNNHSSIHSNTSSSYEDVYVANLEITKNSCIQNQEQYFSLDEVRMLAKWLNRREDGKFKPFGKDGDIPDVNYFGSFNVHEIMFADRIIGLTLIFTSNAPYGFGNEINNEYFITAENNTFGICANSDEIGILYPNVQVICMENGKLKITNKTTGTTVSIDNCSLGEVIKMDGEHEIIITNNTDHSSLYNDFNYSYLDIEVLLDGTENFYEVSMPCKILINYLPIRKVGVI